MALTLQDKQNIKDLWGKGWRSHRITKELKLNNMAVRRQVDKLDLNKGKMASFQRTWNDVKDEVHATTPATPKVQTPVAVSRPEPVGSKVISEATVERAQAPTPAAPKVLENLPVNKVLARFECDMEDIDAAVSKGIFPGYKEKDGELTFNLVVDAAALRKFQAYLEESA